ncbi:hypothetical protein HXX76_007014 [Chlamydomonas incerta]|uniref:phytol kinase n=1 Tax=Chlamydomonas incerta TaxID=51695 RepID=A0A835SZ12_CHLIN|nr:hypothetical protein HXX76_007014 [Chlamydomonas incerta]|eukprot:KAG2435819.1 hypothetical protein HXX76_007014 [Chlamydomonas incerta]
MFYPSTVSGDGQGKGAWLAQELAAVAEEAENAGVIERLGPQKAREARIALGQAIGVCLDGIADAGRALTQAGPPDRAEVAARMRAGASHPVLRLVGELSAECVMQALVAAARFVRRRLWPLATEELAAARAEQGKGKGEEQGKDGGEGNGQEEEQEEEGSQAAGGAAAGSSGDAPSIQTKVKVKRVNDSIRIMSLGVGPTSAAELARQGGASGAALLLSSAAALHGALGAVRHECTLLRSASPSAKTLLNNMIKSHALEELADTFLAAPLPPPAPPPPPPPAEPPPPPPYTSVYCMAHMALCDALMDVCGLAGPCGPGPIMLLTTEAVRRMRYLMLAVVADSARTDRQGNLVINDDRDDNYSWPLVHRNTLRAVFGPRVQLTRTMHTFVVCAAGAPIAAQQHSPEACAQAACMAFPDSRNAIELSAAVTRALAARMEHLGAAGAAEPPAEARVTPRMLYDAARHFPPIVHALLGDVPERQAAEMAGEALLMYGWLLRCCVSPAGLAGAGREGLRTAAESLMPFCTTFTPGDRLQIERDPLSQAWRRMPPPVRAAAAARVVAARIPQSMDLIARRQAAAGEVPIEAVAGSADMLTLLLRVRLQDWRARLAAALAVRAAAARVAAAKEAEEEEGAAAAAAAAHLAPLPAPPVFSELGLLLTAVKLVRCKAERLAAANAAAAASVAAGTEVKDDDGDDEWPTLIMTVMAEHMVRWVGHREGGLASLLPELQPAARAAAGAGGSSNSSSSSGSGGKAGNGKGNASRGKDKPGGSSTGAATSTTQAADAADGGGCSGAELLALGEARRVVLETMALVGMAVMRLHGEMLEGHVRELDKQDGPGGKPGSAPPREDSDSDNDSDSDEGDDDQDVCELLASIVSQLLTLVALLPPAVLLAAPTPPQRLLVLLARALLRMQQRLALDGGGGDGSKAGKGEKGGKKKKRGGGSGGGGGGGDGPGAQAWKAAMDGWRELVLRLSAEPRLCAGCVPGWLWGAAHTDGTGKAGGKAGRKAGGKAGGGGGREIEYMEADLAVAAVAAATPLKMERTAAAAPVAAGGGPSTSAQAAASASTPGAAASGTDTGTGAAAAGAPAAGVTVPAPVLLVRGAVAAAALGSPCVQWSPLAWTDRLQQVVALAQATLRAESQGRGPPTCPTYQGWREAAAQLPGGGEAGLLAGAAARLCGNPRCSNFGGPSEAALELKRCTGCRVVRYCGAACQREHWKGGHKEACGRPPPQ